MASAKRFTVDGVEDAVKRVKKIIAVVDETEEVQDIFFEAATMVADFAQSIAPVSDDKYDQQRGLLRSQIHAERRGKKFPSAVVILRIRDVRYGAFEEFGTKHNAANPFFRPAIAARGPALVEFIAYKLRALIEGANG